MTKTKTLLISVLSIFILFSIILYAVPGSFNFLFNSILGKIILALLIAGVAFGMKDYRLALGLAAILVILYKSAYFASDNKEGFTSWPDDLISQFNSFQATHNPTLVYDINIVQQQASPAEASYLLQNNVWPWSDQTKQLYLNSLSQNTIIKTQSDVSLQQAQSIYNETAIKQLLSMSTKEGSFLLSGAVIGQSDNMPANVNNIVRCGNNNGTFGMEQVVYTGYDSINGNMTSQITSVDNGDIPSVVPGFNFVNSPCNPCVVLENPSDYSCPFTLDTGSGSQISPIWQTLWGVTNPVVAPSVSATTATTSSSNSNSAAPTSSAPAAVTTSNVATYSTPPLGNPNPVASPAVSPSVAPTSATSSTSSSNSPAVSSPASVSTSANNSGNFPLLSQLSNQASAVSLSL